MLNSNQPTTGITSNKCTLHTINNGITGRNLPPFKGCLSAEAAAERATASLPTNTGRRRKSCGISARQRAQRRLRPATPFTQRKQKTCEHGSCTGYEHCCRQTGHSARDAASSDDTEITHRITTTTSYENSNVVTNYLSAFTRCHLG